MLAYSELHATDDFVENFFGLGRVARPDARMQLNAGGRGEDGGFRVGIQLVKRAHTLLHFRFGQAGYAQVAGEKALGVSHTGQARRNFGFEDRFQFSGRPGQQNYDVAFGFDPQAGSGAARVRQDYGAFRDHGLAHINFRHGARKFAKTFLNGAKNFVVAMQFAAEHFGDGFAGAVVISGPQAAATYDEFGTVHGVSKG